MHLHRCVCALRTAGSALDEGDVLRVNHPVLPAQIWCIYTREDMHDEPNVTFYPKTKEMVSCLKKTMPCFH